MLAMLEKDFPRVQAATTQQQLSECRLSLLGLIHIIASCHRHHHQDHCHHRLDHHGKHRQEVVWIRTGSWSVP